MNLRTLAERFCTAPLPDSVRADFCATRRGPGRTGTNLLTVQEAEAVLGYTLGAMAGAARDVLAERQRQIEAEGWTPDHDDQHDRGELAEAGACYAHTASLASYCAHQQSLSEDQRDIDLDEIPAPNKWGAPEARDESMDLSWPWAEKWWKPGERRRMLVKSAALILAEIERLDRAAERAK